VSSVSRLLLAGRWESTATLLDGVEIVVVIAATSFRLGRHS
jgi:hypothetical protein